MIVNPLYLLSFMFSALLAFFTTALVVHGLIYCFQIRKYRIRYILRLLPFLGVVLDFLIFEYSLSNWLNPLSCSSCIQKVVLSLFFPDLQTYLSSNQISLINYLSSQDPYHFGYLFTIVIGGISILLISRKLLQIFVFNRSVKSIVKNGVACSRAIANSPLNALIEYYGTKIIVSRETHLPMATHLNAIVMFPDFNQLSQDEFEAVIAHEMEHIKWKDPLLKLVINIFTALFWWVPVKSWITKMEQEQEMGCDQQILKHQFSEVSLASALVKVATHAKDQKTMTTCYLVNKENPVLKRVKAILNRYPHEKVTVIGGLIIMLGMLLLLICMNQ